MASEFQHALDAAIQRLNEQEEGPQDEPLFDIEACRVCGCTDDCACPGGCYWVEDDLCSDCVDIMKRTGLDEAQLKAVLEERLEGETP